MKITLECLQDIVDYGYPSWFSTIFHQIGPNYESHETDQLGIDLFL